jgi:hypothetical protein
MGVVMATTRSAITTKAHLLMCEEKDALHSLCMGIDRDYYIVSNHNRETCNNHREGDIEGSSRYQCIARQRQINDAYYQEEKDKMSITSPPSTGAMYL